MPQARKSAVMERTDDNRIERQEVCSYIFDLLGSLEAIAARQQLPVLARLIAAARSEARDSR